ncbi:hypothetical protein ACP70R_011452 [Stipagrostis hirtigluma subsp. patula]
MERWVMIGKGIAMKIRNATELSNHQLGELITAAYTKCPNCHCCIDMSDVYVEWPGLPDGFRFDPSDLGLIEHLERQVGLSNSKPHVLINECIPTIEILEGICYTHPKNLPGMKVDGSSRHFFRRVSNAYKSGKRKCRKINDNHHTIYDEHIRWHKTGNSKAIYDNNGVIRGWKKILVLLEGSKKGVDNKKEKNSWVMHQYGLQKDEKDEELVVSKVFYQLPSKKIGQKGDMSQMASTVNSDSGTQKSIFPFKTEQYTPIQLDHVDPTIKFPAKMGGRKILARPFVNRMMKKLKTLHGLLDCHKLLFFFCGELSQAAEDVDLPDLDEHRVTWTQAQVSESDLGSNISFGKNFLDTENVSQTWPPVSEFDSGLCARSGEMIWGSDVRERQTPQRNQVMGTCAENTHMPPPDCSNMDALHGFPDMDNPLCVGMPPDHGTSSLADLQFGSQDSFGDLLDSFC